MATAEEVLNISRSHVGEAPNRFWDWYPAPAGTAWCCIYQSYVLTEAGIDTHFAWVSGLFDSLRNAGNYTSTNPRDAQPGMLVAFEWNSTPGGYDHIAMVESVDDNGITAINGNWGGKVTRAWHSFNGGGIAEVAMPSYSDSAVPNNPAPAPTPPTSSNDEWKVGSTGDKVREIQKIVGVEQDGVFGPQTEAAVKVWQSNLKITADGVWGPQTEKATADLFTFLSNIQTGDAANPFLDELNNARTQVLRQGSTGGSVTILQVGLNAKGYALVGDGIFGPATDGAVRQFQSDKGLQVDGIVGPQTWEALLS